MDFLSHPLVRRANFETGQSLPLSSREATKKSDLNVQNFWPALYIIAVEYLGHREIAKERPHNITDSKFTLEFVASLEF